MRSKNTKKALLFPCNCGHSNKLHAWAGVSIGDEWCNGFERRAKTIGELKLKWPCPCEAYVPDNLKYLEQCLKKKGKGKLK